jgi:hypothetical protein
MALDITTSITGVVLNGFSAPTYTLALDTPPANNAKQSIVTALGGTQTGVRTHTPSDPFSITVSKPVIPVPYPKTNLQGVVGKAGRNKYVMLIRKGTLPLTGQSPQVSDLRIETNVVSGADVNDKANLAALYSAGAALLNREAANLLVASTTGSI